LNDIFVIVEVCAWAELLRDRIETGGRFEVVGIAADGEDALEEIARLDRPPDIVLVDAGSRLGLKTARALRGRDEAMRFVAIGLDDDPAQVLSWAMAGAKGLVARTASLDELLGAVAGVARGEAPCSPEVTGALLRGVGESEGRVLGGAPGERLTGRECEVARLVAAGLTNKEIAADLQIEPGTVKSHVHSVIRKLGVSRRAQVAAELHADGRLDRWHTGI
jgi:DNA-binding NarL/FixJ family response regulator